MRASVRRSRVRYLMMFAHLHPPPPPLPLHLMHSQLLCPLMHRHCRPSVMRYRICEGGLLVDVPSSMVQERIEDIEARLVRNLTSTQLCGGGVGSMHLRDYG